MAYFCTLIPSVYKSYSYSVRATWPRVSECIFTVISLYLYYFIYGLSRIRIDDKSVLDRSLLTTWSMGQRSSQPLCLNILILGLHNFIPTTLCGTCFGRKDNGTLKVFVSQTKISIKFHILSSTDDCMFIL